MSVKKIISTLATVLVIGGVGAGGWYLYKHNVKPGSASSSKVFVQKVSNLNTVNSADLFATDFSGVIEAQRSVEVKYDQNKTIDEILVKEGDHVKKGDKLLTYDVEELQIKIDEAQLEIESMQNGITINENEIKQYEEEKRKAPADEQAYLAAEILQLQAENARSEYDIKTKGVEVTKLQSSLENAYVVAPISGTVKDLKDPSAGTTGDIYSTIMNESGDVVMKITAEGNYRVKGTFNEQNATQIQEKTPVIIKSRKDDTQWHGVINEIDLNPQGSQNMYAMYYSDDEENKSSNYAFYVEPDSLDGFMLGQHVLIEIDNGQEEKKEKEGIWLYSDFILKDGTKNFVWAKTDKDRIEKRYVELGEVDDDYGDTQILKGLENEDYIAYPSDYIEEGMKTTTNQSDKDIPKNELGGMNTGNMGDMGDMGEMGDMGDMGMGEMPEMEYDEDGNMVMTDPDGNKITTKQDGSVKIESPDGGVIEMSADGTFTKGSIDMNTGEYTFDYEDGEGGDKEDEGSDDETETDKPAETKPEASDITFEDIYGISEEEFQAMTPQEQDEFLKAHYEGQ